VQPVGVVEFSVDQDGQLFMAVAQEGDKFHAIVRLVKETPLEGVWFKLPAIFVAGVRGSVVLFEVCPPGRFFLLAF
jgi:hypothetical protein